MNSHDPIAIAAGLVLLLQRLDVDVQVFNFFPDSANGCRRHVLRQLNNKNKVTEADIETKSGFKKNMWSVL